MENSISSGLGVVLSGGGTRSGYAVGAMRALAEVHSVRRPKAIAALSAGKGVAMFYLAGLFEDMYAWAERFSDPRFISPCRILRGYIIDTNFLVDHILKDQCPDLAQLLEGVETEWFLGATRLADGSPHWFTKRDGLGQIYEQLRAGKTIPGISGEGTLVNGDIFGDGVPSISLADCVAKMFEVGAKKVIVVDNSLYGDTSRLVKAYFRWRTRTYSPEVRAFIEKFIEQGNADPLMPAPNVYVCRHGRLASNYTITRSRRKAHQSIEQGYEDMARLSFD